MSRYGHPSEAAARDRLLAAFCFDGLKGVARGVARVGMRRTDKPPDGLFQHIVRSAGARTSGIPLDSEANTIACGVTQRERMR